MRKIAVTIGVLTLAVAGAGCIELGPDGVPRLDAEGVIMTRLAAEDSYWTDVINHWIYVDPTILEPGRDVVPDDVEAALAAHAAHLESLPDWSVDWDALAECESGGNWSYNGSVVYDGGLQFHPATWRRYGGAEFAPYAWQASPYQQKVIAERTLDAEGLGAWPACTSALGWR